MLQFKKIFILLILSQLIFYDLEFNKPYFVPSDFTNFLALQFYIYVIYFYLANFLAKIIFCLKSKSQYLEILKIKIVNHKN